MVSPEISAPPGTPARGTLLMNKYMPCLKFRYAEESGQVWSSAQLHSDYMSTPMRGQIMKMVLQLRK